MKDQDLTGMLAVVGLFIVCPIALALMLASSKLGPASIPIWLGVAGATWLVRSVWPHEEGWLDELRGMVASGPAPAQG